MMKDIVSNALMRGLEVPGDEVSAFLKQAEQRYPNGEALLRAAAERFELEEKVLRAAVQEYRHCNCSHGRIEGEERNPVHPTQFARDVMLHVVLHEIGHALVREFDMPVLGNEETLADAFATHYLAYHLPDRAPAVLAARVRSFMIEAREVPREEWGIGGEHNHDARRAFQVTSLALAAGVQGADTLAASIGMSEEEVRKSRDYGTEIHRSWRRILAPLWMPEGIPSGEARLVVDGGSDVFKHLLGGGLRDELREVLHRFDWHSQIKIAFEGDRDGAGWSRSKRTITVGEGYVRRFIEQGEFTVAKDRE